MKFLQTKLNKYNLDTRDTDNCNKLEWNTGFKLNRDSFDGKAKHRQPSEINAYTDGSKLDGRTGSGIAIYRGKDEIKADWLRLPDGCTVFQAEVAAIAKAATEIAILAKDGVKYVKIFVDSQAALLAVDNPRVTSNIVATAVRNLNKLANMVRSITLVWIPAHKGFVGNERADELAKRGSQDVDPAHLYRVGMPVATLKSSIRDRIYAEWGEEWEKSSIANHTKVSIGDQIPARRNLFTNW